MPRDYPTREEVETLELELSRRITALILVIIVLSCLLTIAAFAAIDQGNRASFFEDEARGIYNNARR